MLGVTCQVMCLCTTCSKFTTFNANMCNEVMNFSSNTAQYLSLLSALNTVYFGIMVGI